MDFQNHLNVSMRLSNQSRKAIRDAIKEGIDDFSQRGVGSTFSDIHIQAIQESGELCVMDDEEKVLSQIVVSDFSNYDGEDFFLYASNEVQSVLNAMQKEGVLETPFLSKPYSFVMMDEDKERFNDLMIMDDETLIVSGGLLEGLDEDLNAFLKDLLKDTDI